MRGIRPELVTQSIAVVLTAGLLYALHVQNRRILLPREARQTSVQLSLEEPTPAAPTPPAPAPPAPARPKSNPMPPHPAPAHASRHVPQPSPLELESPVAAPDPMPSPDAGAAIVMATEAAAPAQSGVPRASIESAYAAALRENVDARTSVPNSAEYRLLKPSGAAQIRFVLDRAGSPSDVSVARTSGSGILDRRALDIVASGHYPPFPDAAFPGESRHTFVVTIEFRS